MVVLPGRRGESGRQVTVRVFDFEAVFAMFGVESIAENGEEPSAQIRSGFVSGQVGPGFHQRLLDEIVGPIRLPRQRHGEGSQGRNRREQFRFQRTVRVSQFPSPWPSDPADREFPSPSPSQMTGPSPSWHYPDPADRGDAEISPESVDAEFRRILPRGDDRFAPARGAPAHILGPRPPGWRNPPLILDTPQWKGSFSKYPVSWVSPRPRLARIPPRFQHRTKSRQATASPLHATSSNAL